MGEENLKEYWCCTLVILRRGNVSIKEIKSVMNKISEWLGYAEWDYTAKEALKKGENYIDIHDWKQKETRKKLEDILKDVNIYYNIIDESLGGCEACIDN